MDSQQQEGTAADYVAVSSLEPTALLPSRASVDWFIRGHGHELIEAGALIPGRGRMGSVVHREIFPRKVVEIKRREALAANPQPGS